MMRATKMTSARISAKAKSNLGFLTSLENIGEPAPWLRTRLTLTGVEDDEETAIDSRLLYFS